MIDYHVSVLLSEALDALQIRENGTYIDATLGGGGHAKAIIEKGGIVLGIDQDTDALEHVKKNLKFEILHVKLQVVQGNFRDIVRIAKENGNEKVDGVLFDIGISSHHVDSGERGFSFLKNAPLDMRMDKSISVRAADLVHALTKPELIELFTKYGEEPYAKRIAEEIVRVRLQKPIQTTFDLADLVAKVVPKRGKTHPATKVFQALRIAVNDELHALEEGLDGALEIVKASGRIVVISFHSLEERIVKHTFGTWEEKGKGKHITDKPISPSKEEVTENWRSRSAKLRIFEKI